MATFNSEKHIIVAVPGMERYAVSGGIGRVLQELVSGVTPQVKVVPAQFRASRLPILRNIPTAVEVGSDVDVVLLPQMTGAQSLRNTRGRPSIAIVHDLGLLDCESDREEFDFITRRVTMYAFRGLKYASRIIAVSEFTRDRLLHHAPDIPAHRVQVIYNGVSPVFLDQRQSREGARQTVDRLVHGRLRGPLLLYVGTERLRKNMDLLMRVLQNLKREHPTVQVLKVGSAGASGRRAATVRAMHQDGLVPDDDVIFLESLSDTDLAAVYAAADVFISPSLYEGFGLPLLEAMAAGTPAVVSNCGGFPEIAGEVAWVAEPSLPAFTAAVRQALAYPRGGARVTEGRARAARFSWSASSHAYLQVIRQLTNRSPEDACVGLEG